jgi:Predicted ATPase involved in cell division
VLADDPPAILDAEISHHIMNFLVELNRGLTSRLVLATHDEKIMGY